MAKIIRKTASIFCGGLSSGSDQVEQFGSKIVVGTPIYTVDPAVIQGGTSWGNGWSPALNPTNNSEYKQDRNGVDLVATYQIAYLLQQGIPEWDNATTYYEESVVSYNGLFYISLIDNNTGNEPDTSPSNWRNMSAQPTTTVKTSGSGTYTPPVGCVAVAVRMVGGGGGGAGSTNGSAGGNTTFGSFTAGGGGGGTQGGSPVGGAGGTASGGSVNIAGSAGGVPGFLPGAGGASAFGGQGASPTTGTSNAGATNSGSGGSGNGTGTAGGGAGGYVEGSVVVSGTISYAVGAGGAAGTGGGAGGSGIIIITEYYY